MVRGKQVLGRMREEKIENILALRGDRVPDVPPQTDFHHADELMRFIRHLNHATMILNPETGGRKTTRPAARRRLEKELKSLHYDELMEDDSLDRCGR